jgi:hypothetical protein
MRGPDEPRELRPLKETNFGEPIRVKRRPPKVQHNGRVTVRAPENGENQ